MDCDVTFTGDIVDQCVVKMNMSKVSLEVKFPGLSGTEAKQYSLGATSAKSIDDTINTVVDQKALEKFQNT